jgi:arsenite/tail-anchored protein-transporting ATPase
VQELAFFVGKGGVGKTTISAAYAIHSALQNPGERVLLLSTDPAHSLADVLQVSLKSRPRSVPLPRKTKLFAWQIDVERRFRDFLDQYKEQILQVVEMGSIFTRADIEPLIDSTLPGMAEVSALLAIDDAMQSGEYARIIVDTAPFGHTLRLFALPEQFLKFLDFLELSASRDQVLAAHFGGHAQNLSAKFLGEWRSMLEGIQRALALQAKLFLVTTPEKFSLNEAVRCRDVLAGYSPPIIVNAVLLNRAVVKAGDCGSCTQRAKATRDARAFIKTNFPQTATHLGEDPGQPIMGARDLASFADHVFLAKPLRLKIKTPRIRQVRLRKTTWPALDVPLSFVLGKGGVGKTTISAALGLTTRKQRNTAVEICSVDPAPSLDDIFQMDTGDRPQAVLGDKNFRASELDSAALFHQWVSELKSSVDDATTAEVSGIHVDLSFERRLLEQLLDIVPPGVDEVLAIFRILDLLDRGDERVLIDMAPTGHGLELLRMPDRILAWTRPLLKTLALHRTLAMAREAGVKIAELAHRVRELVGVLKDSEQAQVWAVMLPEPLPDRETERLMGQLEGMHLPAKAVFVNRVLFEEQVENCPHCRTAMAWQHATLSLLKQRYPQTNIYVVRNFAREIAGKPALNKLTNELWELA